MNILKEIRKQINKESGITGLETAIILIAFVMVASVLSYVVLSTGLFSSQKAKEAVNSGLAEVRSTMELKGNVIAKTESGYIDEVYFTVGCYGASDAIDFTDTADNRSVVVISYSDAFQQIPRMDWTMTRLTSLNTDSMLEPNELFLVTVDMSVVNTGASDNSSKLGPYHRFTLEVKPPRGAVLTIERTVPARTSQMINLE